jgi:hypothetical protein
MLVMPRVTQVRACKGYFLHVTFENGVKKIYDLKPRLKDERFKMLRDQGFFKAVQVDGGGFGISWNDDVDLSENELWTEGKTLN